MKATLLFLCAVLAGHAAFASNPQDEQTVRNAYAKLAYAVQAYTVYVTQQNPKVNSADLAKELQTDELRFDIADISSGALADISSKPYSSFVTKLDTQPILEISPVEVTFNDPINRQRATSYFADRPRWTQGHESGTEDWNILVGKAMEMSGKAGKFSRYVTATITVRFQGQSRTYHTLWLFGYSPFEPLAIDLVTGQVVRDFALESAYPSVLTDTRLRSRAVVNDWLNSTQRFEPSCKTGKQDVCCDSAMLACGIASEDLRSTKPAPSTKDAPKGGQN